MIEKSLRYNSSQVDLWTSYLQFYEDYQQNMGPDGEEMMKQLFERAIQNVGKDMKSAQIWIKYIDFENSNFHFSFGFLLCFAAIQTPLLEIEQIHQK